MATKSSAGGGAMVVDMEYGKRGLNGEKYWRSHRFFIAMEGSSRAMSETLGQPRTVDVSEMGRGISHD